MKPRKPVVALAGNPNSGKSSLFNELTGLRQKVGNFPGVTVDKKTGITRVPGKGQTEEVVVVDLPGLYSIYPKSEDEKVVMDVLANPDHADFPDAVIVVADASNLSRNLLLFTEIADLGRPVVLALNMLDIAVSMQLEVNAVKLAMELGVPVVKINARNGEGLDRLKEAVAGVLEQPSPAVSFFNPSADLQPLLEEVSREYGIRNPYLALQYVCQHDHLSFLQAPARVRLDQLIEKHGFDEAAWLQHETIARYEAIHALTDKAVKSKGGTGQHPATAKLDKLLLHPFWGYVIFLAVLLLVFQALFSWAAYPMDLIDEATSQAISWTKEVLPTGLLNDLLTDGIMAGIGGVIIFIPQIGLLYALVGLLEESGYMARVMVIMDRIMRPYGLNGRSVVPLISGVACAVPAIMSARTISNRYERLVTIMATPMMACSARLPIYTILIALVVPDQKVLGVLNLQGLALLGLYLLGVAGAIFTAYLMTVFVKRNETGYLILELPTYKWPRWNHVGVMMYDSVRAFVVQAGKVIVAVSIILWVLAAYGPGDSQDRAEEQVREELTMVSDEALEAAVSSVRLETSYAGRIGQAMEPVIRPLGYDWKIGIALLASFAAREVFVGTMATIYSIGASDAEDESTIKERLRNEINPETGGPRYTPAVAMSLLVFYAFAMMCMSTLAAVYRETGGWKWPLIQLAYTMSLAWILSFAVYQLMN